MRIVIVTGGIDSGKTRYLSGVVSALKDGGASVGGILCPGVYVSGQKTGYDALDIETGKRAPLVSVTPFAEGFSYGRFFFSAQGYRFAASALRRLPYPACLIMDEIGPVELGGRGYAEDLRFLVSRYDGILILVVREQLREAVCETFGLYEFPLETRKAGGDSGEFLLEIL